MGRVTIRIGVLQVVVAGLMLTQPTAGGFTTNSSQSRDIAGKKYLQAVSEVHQAIVHVLTTRRYAGRNVAPPGHIIQIPCQPVFALIP